jgi:uncharacterized protein (DUF4415 family)
MSLSVEDKKAELARIKADAAAEKVAIEAEVKGYNKISNNGKSAIVDAAEKSGAPLAEVASAVVKEFNQEKSKQAKVAKGNAGRPSDPRPSKNTTFRIYVDLLERFKKATYIYPEKLGSNSMSKLLDKWIEEKLDEAGV